MNPIARWASDLARIPSLTQASLLRVSQHTDSLNRAELEQTLNGLGPVNGWLMETGAVRELRDTPPAPQGIPLAGEWQQGDRHWTLEHLHGEQWQLHCFQCQPANDTDATHLGVLHHQIHSSGSGRLAYWNLWEPGEDQAPENRLALFVGFEE